MAAEPDDQALAQTTGIPSVRLQAMRLVFERYTAVEAVRVFGARANGKFNDRSGVNLAVFGTLEPAQLKSVTQDLDALDTGYAFDVRSYSDLGYPPMRMHVDTEGVEIYRAGPQQIHTVQPLQGESTEVVVRPQRVMPWAILSGVGTFVVASLVSWGAMGTWVVPMSFVIGPFALLIPFVIPLFLAAVVASLANVLVGAIRFFRDSVR